MGHCRLRSAEARRRGERRADRGHLLRAKRRDALGQERLFGGEGVVERKHALIGIPSAGPISTSVARPRTVPVAGTAITLKTRSTASSRVRIRTGRRLLSGGSCRQTSPRLTSCGAAPRRSRPSPPRPSDAASPQKRGRCKHPANARPPQPHETGRNRAKRPTPIRRAFATLRPCSPAFADNYIHRGGRIRTGDLGSPKAARYQASLRPESNKQSTGTPSVDGPSTLADAREARCRGRGPHRHVHKRSPSLTTPDC